MIAFVVTTFIGSFGLDENKKVLLYKEFPKNPEKIAHKMNLSESELIDEEKHIMKELWNMGYKKFIFGVKKKGVKNVEYGNLTEQFVRENLRKMAVDYNFVRDQVEFNQFLTKVNVELTKVKIKMAVERDSLVIQANGVVEELNKSVNVLVERLREFFGLYFPEMSRIIGDHRKYATIVEKCGYKDRMEDPELKQLAQKSMGMDLREEDIKTIQLLARKILELYELREYATKYMEKLVKEVAPNFTELAGPVLSAKMISIAGGLEKLAKMPSSTIQLLGSERLLFKYLRSQKNVKLPKHGIIAIHPMIQNAPQQCRGRVARAIASKLAIAARMDYYSKEYKANKLKAELEERVREILKAS